MNISNPQDLLLFGGSTGAVFAVVMSVTLPLARRWVEGRTRLSEKRAEVQIANEQRASEAQIANEQRESEARVKLLEEERRTVVRVADAQERIAVSFEIMADHVVKVEARMDRIEAHLGVSEHATPPPPVPFPRRPLGSVSDTEKEPVRR